MRQDPGNESSELVVVETASTASMAQIIAGILKAAGIPAYVAGSLLQDEWAMSQKLMGLLAVEVQVPRKSLEEARKVLEDARREAALRKQEEPPEPPTMEPERDNAETGDEKELPARGKVELWAETGLVVFLVVLPHLLYLFSSEEPSQLSGKTALNFSYFYGLFLSFQDCALVLYLIWRSGEPWSRFGLSRPRWILDIVLGLSIWMVDKVVHSMIQSAFGPLGLSRGTLDRASLASTNFFVPGLFDYILAAISCSFRGFKEELVMRGYLLPKFERLLGSTWKSLLLTSVLFASLHAYSGVRSVIATFAAGLLYGAAFCWIRRLWPLALAHATWNFMLKASLSRWPA